MSDFDFTPTTDEVRQWFSGAQDEYLVRDLDEAEAAFDRWLAEHERQVREQIARDIVARATPSGSEHFRHGYGCAQDDAARIARGGAS